MVVRILCRVPGRPDVVLDLVPNHYERVDFAHDGDTYVYPPHVAILLLDDGAGYSDTTGRHIDPQHPPVVEQLGLGDLAGGVR
jgi:hypothetical protein